MKITKTNQIIYTPHSWSDMPWGDSFRDTLTQHLQPCLSKLYGFHLLKIGHLSIEIDTKSCSISHQINVGEVGMALQVIANPLNLPFETKSIDACMLAHTLSWSLDPHRILREVDRVLIDNGWIIITGFNPLSVLGAGKLLPGLHRYPPWNSHMFSQMRLLDWLNLLNYEVVFRSYFQVVPWKCYDGKMINIHISSLGCLNIIVARKRTLPLTILSAKKNVSKTKLQATVNVTNRPYKTRDHNYC